MEIFFFFLFEAKKEEEREINDGKAEKKRGGEGRATIGGCIQCSREETK